LIVGTWADSAQRGRTGGIAARKKPIVARTWRTGKCVRLFGENAFASLGLRKSALHSQQRCPICPLGIAVGTIENVPGNWCWSGGRRAKHCAGCMDACAKRPKREQTHEVRDYSPASERLIQRRQYHGSCHVRGGPR
jgi:hypothetical protein